jgi:hypothetical protein
LCELDYPDFHYSFAHPVTGRSRYKYKKLEKFCFAFPPFIFLNIIIHILLDLPVAGKITLDTIRLKFGRS